MAIKQLNPLEQENSFALDDKINDLTSMVIEGDEEPSLAEVMAADDLLQTEPQLTGDEVEVAGLGRHISGIASDAVSVYKVGKLPEARPELPPELADDPLKTMEDLNIEAISPEEAARYQEVFQGRETLSGRPMFTGTRMDLDMIQNNEDFAAHLNALSEVSKRESIKIGHEQTIQSALDRGWTMEELGAFLDPSFKPGDQTFTEAMATAALMNIKAADINLAARKEIDDAGGWQNATPEQKLNYSKTLDYSLAVYDALQGRKSDAGRALNFANATIQPGMPVDSHMAKLFKKHGGEHAMYMAYKLGEKAKTPKESLWIARAKSMGERGMDMMMYSFYNSMLSSVDTAFRITAGSALFTGLRAAERPLAAAYGKARYYGTRTVGLDPDRPISMRELMANYATMPIAFADALRMGSKTFVENQQNIGFQRSDYIPKTKNPFEFEVTEKDGAFSKSVKMASKGYGTLLSVPNRGIMGLDDAFKAFNMHIELNGLAARQADNFYHDMIEAGASPQEAMEKSSKLMEDLMRYPSEQMWNDARTLGEEIALTQKLEGSLGHLEKFVNTLPLAKIYVPFLRTATQSIVKQSQYIPLVGLASKQFRNDLMSNGPRHDIAMARMGLGGIIGMSVIPFVMDSDIDDRDFGITGAMPYDRDERMNRIKRGEQPFSIWRKRSLYTPEELEALKDDPYVTVTADRVYRSYVGFEPTSAIIGAWATAIEYMAVNDDAEFNERLVLSMTEGTATYITDMPMLAKVGDFYDSVVFREKGQTVTSALAGEALIGLADFSVRGTPAGAYSSLLGYVDRLYEPEQWQSTSSTENYNQLNPMLRNVLDVVNQHRVNNPVWRAFHEEDIYPKYDIMTGDQRTREGSVPERTLPFRQRTYNNAPAWKAIFLAEVPLPSTPKKIEKVPLSGEQKSVWENAVGNEPVSDESGFSLYNGRTMREELDRIAEDKLFLELITSTDPAERDMGRKMVSEVVNAAEKFANSRVRQEFPELDDMIAQKEYEKEQARIKYQQRVLQGLQQQVPQ